MTAYLYKASLFPKDCDDCTHRNRDNGGQSQHPTKHDGAIWILVVTICHRTKLGNTEQPNKLEKEQKLFIF